MNDQINMLVFHSTITLSHPATTHAQLATIAKHDINKFLCGELTALASGDFVCQNFASCPVNDRRKAHKCLFRGAEIFALENVTNRTHYPIMNTDSNEALGTLALAPVNRDNGSVEVGFRFEGIFRNTLMRKGRRRVTP